MITICNKNGAHESESVCYFIDVGNLLCYHAPAQLDFYDALEGIAQNCTVLQLTV